MRKAIEAKPDWPAAYAVLSDALREGGSKDEAKEVLEQGLRHMPNAKMLKRRLKKL